MIIINSIDGERVEVPIRKLPIVTSSPSPTISIAPTIAMDSTTLLESLIDTSNIITSVHTTISMSTKLAHTSPGPQVASTIPEKITIGAPLTMVTLTIDLLTEQKNQEGSIASTSQQEETGIYEAQEGQEPGSLLEAAQMAQTYMNYMIIKAEEIQEEELNLYEEIGHLYPALEEKKKETQQAEAKLAHAAWLCGQSPSDFAAWTDRTHALQVHCPAWVAMGSPPLTSGQAAGRLALSSSSSSRRSRSRCHQRQSPCSSQPSRQTACQASSR